MGQPNPQPKGSALSHLVQCIFFFLLAVILMIPMVYVAGNDDTHDEDPHPLDSVFINPSHLQVLQALESKQKYLAIEGERDSGVVTFLKHYASASREKRTVLLREYTNDPFDTAYSVFRFAKTLVESHLDLEEEDDTPKTWVLIGFDRDIPKEDIIELQAQSPNDKIVLVSPNRLKVKGFQKIKFPSVPIEELELAMQKEFSISEKTARILTTHYGTVPEIFNNLNNPHYSIEAILEDDFETLDEVNEEEKAILQTLCAEGSSSGKKLTPTLERLGVIFINGQYYWANQNPRLNYALQTESLCQLTQATPEQLEQFNQFSYRTDEEENPEQANNDEKDNTQQKEQVEVETEAEEEQKVKKSKKQKSSKKVSKKKEAKETKDAKSSQPQETKDSKKSKKSSSKVEQKKQKVSKKVKQPIGDVELDQQVIVVEQEHIVSVVSKESKKGKAEKNKKTEKVKKRSQEQIEEETAPKKSKKSSKSKKSKKAVGDEQE